MGALIGNEIIQSRIWVDSKVVEIPNLNYKHMFPITVFDAVRAEMADQNSPTLKQVLDLIHQELEGKQPMIDGKPANYLMTFAGVAGAVGSIQISKDIPWDPEQRRHDRIPTEKAVGDLLTTLGLLDENGQVDMDGKKVRWSDIIGRPTIYHTLGMNSDGVVIQKAITEAINNLQDQITNITDDNSLQMIAQKLDNHINRTDDPHDVSLSQIGAVSQPSFDSHVDNFDNPHQVTKDHLNLENVDNTSDVDKPISNATKSILNTITDLIQELNNDINNLVYVVDALYSQSSGELTLMLSDGSDITVNIPIGGLVKNITFDDDEKELVIYELGGHNERVDLSNLYIRYVGSTGPNIDITVDGDQTTGEQIIRATLHSNIVESGNIGDDSIKTEYLQDQSVTTEKIKDLAVTTTKLADDGVTTEKIDDHAITNIKIDNRAVDGRTLFSSTVNNRVLGVLTANTDPDWIQINGQMILDNVIGTNHLINDSVTSVKLADASVTTDKLNDASVINSKIGDLQVTNDKIEDKTISGDKLVDDIILNGTPIISQRPTGSADNDQIPDTKWVNDRIKNLEIKVDNIPNRSIDGRMLFSSSVADRALVVLSNNGDPKWGFINGEMIEDGAIKSKHFGDKSIIGDKLADRSIESRHFTYQSIVNDHIANNAIESWNMWKSHEANRVLAVLTPNGTPVYTRINREMLIGNSVSTEQIEDRSVTLVKLETSDTPNRLLGVDIRFTNPQWMQANNGMLGTGSVDGRVLFKSPMPNRVLGVYTTDDPASWLQVNGDMIQSRTINHHHLIENAIRSENINDKAIESRHIMDWTIKTNNIAPRAITGVELFTSPQPNRVLGVTHVPFSDPAWLQITTDIIKDEAVTGDKIFKPKHPYRVLGATSPFAPPEYVPITNEFISDNTIESSKLVRDLIFFGTPEITTRPPANSDNGQIPDTRWVRQAIISQAQEFEKLIEMASEVKWDNVTYEMLQDRIVDGTKLFTNDTAPRVLGITHPGEDVEFILIETDLIVNGAVTQDKLARDITLMGSPAIEIRPSPYASDLAGGGNLIPDCQWVLDAINKYCNCGGGGGPIIPPIDITTKSIHITDNHPDSPKVADMWLKGTAGNVSEFDTMSESMYLTAGEPSSYELGDIWLDGMPGNISDIDDKMTKLFIGGKAPINPAKGDIWLDGADLETDPEEGGPGSGYPGSGGPVVIEDGSITTSLIADRSVTGDKLFTSSVANRLLGVTTPNTSPYYLQAINEMISDRAIDGRTLFSSSVADRILGVDTPNTNPKWMQINHNMMGTLSVGLDQMIDNSISTSKLQNGAVTSVKLATSPMIDTIRLMDNSVTTVKIVNQAIETNKIANAAITAEKIVSNVVLSGHPTIPAHTTYETRSLRNTILSPNPPSNYENGDIWFRYI